MESATLSLILFVVFTLIYFIYRYFKFNQTSFKIVTAIYFLSVIASQFIINISLTKELCGESSYGNAFLYTFIPWVVIFGLLNIALMMFPGWKAPFSNTFGYLVVKAAGIRSLLTNNILKQKYKGSSTLSEKGISNSINDIYSDPSILINQVTPDTFDSFWKRMSPLLKGGSNLYRNKLKQLIVLKDLVGEFFWYLLTGMLVCSMSYNSILNQGCDVSVKEMQKRHRQYEEDIKKKQKEDQSKKPQRIYNVTD